MAGVSGATGLQVDGSKGSLGKRNIPLKVKNTFIDIARDLEEDDLNDTMMQDSFQKRQMSEPPPSLMHQHSLMSAFSNEFFPEFGSYSGWDAPSYAGDSDELAKLERFQAGLGKALAEGALDEGVTLEGLDLGVELPQDQGEIDADDGLGNLDGWGADDGLTGGVGGLGGMAMSEMLSAAGLPPPEWANTTTVMMRNLPNKYTQRMLLTEINHTGFLGTFDFLYLPIDPETNANRGYAFLNFIDPGFSWMFKKSYEGRKMNRFNSNKVVSVVPATLQGFVANYAHYASSRVNRGDPSARPLFLREPKDDVAMLAGVQGAGFHPPAGQRRGGKRRNGGGAGSALNQLVTAQQAQQAKWKEEEAMWGGASSSMGMGTYFGLDGSGGLATSFQAEGKLKGKAGDASLIPKFCPHCGGAIQSGFQFCPHCGSGLDFGPGAGGGIGGL